MRLLQQRSLAALCDHVTRLIVECGIGSETSAAITSRVVECVFVAAYQMARNSAAKVPYNNVNLGPS